MEYYSLAEDFKFDDFPLYAEFMDETVSEFPLEKGGQYLRSFVNFFSPDAGTLQVEQSCQGLLSDLEKIGLKEWLTMNAD